MRKRSLLALMILLCLLLTGCYAFDSESFYALPKRSEQFSELQAAAEAAMNGGVREKGRSSGAKNDLQYYSEQFFFLLEKFHLAVNLLLHFLEHFLRSGDEEHLRVDAVFCLR